MEDIQEIFLKDIHFSNKKNNISIFEYLLTLKWYFFPLKKGWGYSSQNNIYSKKFPSKGGKEDRV